MDNFKKLIETSDYTNFLKKLDKNFIQNIVTFDLFYSNLDLLVNKYKKNIFKIINKISEVDNSYINKKVLTLMPYYLDGKLNSDYIFIIRKIDLNDVFKYIIDNKLIFKTNNFIKDIINSKGKNQTIIDNLDYIINNSVKILELKNILKEYNVTDNFIKKLDCVIDTNPDKIILELVSINNLTLKDLEQEKILDTLRIILKELKNYFSLDYHDIKYLGRGGFSNVILIGDKVLKVGKKRKCFFIKDNKRFLKPIYRQEIKCINNDSVLICIEITQQVDTINIDGFDLFNIYKELRDQHLIWTDCRLDNIGRLLHDNKIYYNDINKTNINATGYSSCQDEILKKGDIVIIDNDFIYTEKEFQESFNNNKTLQENIKSCEWISDLEYQYQYDKLKNRNKR